MASFGSLKSAIFEREERKQCAVSGAYSRPQCIRSPQKNSSMITEKDDEQSPPLRRKEATVIHKYPIFRSYSSEFPLVLVPVQGEDVSIYRKEKHSNLNLLIKTDQDMLREGYRFIRSEEDDMDPSWEQRLVKRYYDKLFKEYCITDMSQYKSGKIGLRWRTEKEVISGKGQFICGNKHCDEKNGLASYEVNFSYFEAGEDKQALVKLVSCERCAQKLNYKRQKVKERLEKREQENDRRKRSRSKSDDDINEFQESKERRRKGKRTSVSASDHKIDDDDDDSFDEFLEEMFP